MATAETKESNSDLSKTDVTCEAQSGAGSTVKVTAATSLTSPGPKGSNSDLSKTDVTCEAQSGAGSTAKVTAATSLASPEPTRTKYDATNDEDGMIKVTTATNLAIPNLTQSEVDDIRDAFQLFDVDGCGSIDPKDLKEALDGLGYSDKNPAVYAMLTKIDAASLDRNGRLSFDEFLSAMKGNLGAGSNSKEDVDKIFNLFDNDNTGYISLQNLKRVCGEVGECMSDTELLQMIEHADADGDGLINSDDFYKIMTQKTVIG